MTMIGIFWKSCQKLNRRPGRHVINVEYFPIMDIVNARTSRYTFGELANDNISVLEEAHEIMLSFGVDLLVPQRPDSSS